MRKGARDLAALNRTPHEKMRASDGIATANQPERTRRAWYVLALRWAVALLILALLAYFVPIAPLRDALSRISFGLFSGVLLVYFAALGIGVVKWHFVVNAAGGRLSFAVSAQCYLGGLFGALFLPSIVGGDVIRLGVGIARSPRPGAVVTGNIADRILDVGAQLTLVLVGISLLPGSMPVSLQGPTQRVLLVGVSAGVVLLLAFLLFVRPLLRGRSIRIRRWVVQVRQSLRAVSRRPRRLLLGWLLGICVQGTYLALTAVIGSVCGLHLPVRVWLFAWPLSKIAGVLPITQGGIGVREAALVALLKPFGAPAALVVATGIASEGMVIAGGLLAGLSALGIRRLSRSVVVDNSSAATAEQP